MGATVADGQISRSDWAAGVCVLLAFIGALLPWARVPTFLGDMTVAGTDGDGIIVIVFAILAALAVAGFAAWRKRWIGIVTVLCGVIITIIGIVDTANVERLADADDLPVSVGAGLYIVMLAGIALTIIAGIGVFKKRA